ncbi:Pollen receptor-like kinase 3 [Striga hermonthica]|uniref:Pollen receptor-like kinase 3 n=1 Tax=Striga hermonthica TaxID=68872 RepID=A0A9N7R7K9_STRHE|nr:Pollen receptor-like kinase 3 [Striga hermonthica]
MIPATSSVSESEALLKLKESLTNATALGSWKPGTEPCAENNHWVGVKCANGVVTGLRLGNLGLSGTIDGYALASLPHLRIVSFMSNAFSGPLPDFSPLGNLRALFLSTNQFSGEIPSDYFAKLEALRKVWLSGNGFSGPVPPSLAHPAHLVEVHLENNRFTGPVPTLEQPSLVSLNLSNNHLEGEIPAGLSRFGPDAFLGNPGLCGAYLGRPCPDKANRMKIAVWALFTSLVVLFALMIIGIYVLKRRQDRSAEGNFEPSIPRAISGGGGDARGWKALETGRTGSGRSGSGRKGSGRLGKGVGDMVMINEEKGEFGLADLMKAAAEVLGNGPLGSSYKASMAGGLTVVVKRLKETTKMGKEQFDSEVRRLGSLRHKNLLTPLAYHYRKDEKLLVYEYQPKGSLFLVLHGDRGISHAQLTWPVRLKIIQGIARGLAYLHANLPSLDLPHGNLKSANVFLSPDHEPLLSDYGLAPLISPAHAAKALEAYKSPESTVSPKCDVYCLGIIILEMLTGKAAGEGRDVVQLVRSAMAEGREGEVLDPDVQISNKEWRGEMERVLRVGAECTEDEPERRPDAGEAARRVEGITRTVKFRTSSGGLYGGGGESGDEDDIDRA